MSDRETKLRELLERRAEAYPADDEVPPKLVRRARSGMLVTGLAVCLVAAGVAFGAFAGFRALQPSVLPASPTPSTSPVPSPSETAPASPSPAPIDIAGIKLVLPLLNGTVTEMAAANGSIYAVYGPTITYNQAQLTITVARLDLRTHELERSAGFPGRVRIAILGGFLWVTHDTATGSGQRVLERLDASSLATEGSVPFPGSPMNVAASPAGLWVGSGTRVHLLDPADGRVLRTSRLDGDVGPMSVDPGGRLLYVATSVPGNVDPRSLYELDAATGDIRANVPAPQGVAVTGLSSTPQGVWVAVATGLLGHVELHRASDLHLVATFDERQGGPVTNTIGAAVANDILWVTDQMTGVLACGDPKTGKLRSVVIPQPKSGITSFSNAVGSGSEVYLGIAGGVLQITPSAACRG